MVLGRKSDATAPTAAAVTDAIAAHSAVAAIAAVAVIRACAAATAARTAAARPAAGGIGQTAVLRGILRDGEARAVAGFVFARPTAAVYARE